MGIKSTYILILHCNQRLMMLGATRDPDYQV